MDAKTLKTNQFSSKEDLAELKYKMVEGYKEKFQELLEQIKAEPDATQKWKYLRKLTNHIKHVIQQKNHPLRILSHTYEWSEPRYGNTDAYATVVNFGREIILECFKSCELNTYICVISIAIALSIKYFRLIFTRLRLNFCMRCSIGAFLKIMQRI